MKIWPTNNLIPNKLENYYLVWVSHLKMILDPLLWKA